MDATYFSLVSSSFGISAYYWKNFINLRILIKSVPCSFSWPQLKIRWTHCAVFFLGLGVADSVVKLIDTGIYRTQKQPLARRQDNQFNTRQSSRILSIQNLQKILRALHFASSIRVSVGSNYCSPHKLVASASSVSFSCIRYFNGVFTILKNFCSCFRIH